MTSESDSDAEEPAALEPIKVGFMTPVREVRSKKSDVRTEKGF